MEARDEERPYDNIPRKGGQHRGEVPEEHKESAMNVRAPSPPKPDEDAAEETSEDEGTSDSEEKSEE